MFKKLIYILVAQSILILLLNLGSNSNKNVKRTIDLNFNEIKSFEIGDMVDSLKFISKDNKWFISKEKIDYPANQNLVLNLFNSIKSFNLSNLAGSSKKSSKSFLVSNDNFKKYIKIGNEKYFFGESPSFRNVYFRDSKNNNSYIVEFNDLMLNLDFNNWTDKELLHFDKSNIKSFEFNDINFLKNEASFKIDGDKDYSQAVIDNFIQIISNINYISLFADDGYEFKKEINFIYNDDSKQQFLISSLINEEYYYLKYTKYDFIFKVKKEVIENLYEYDIKKFILIEMDDISKEIKDNNS